MEKNYVLAGTGCFEDSGKRHVCYFEKFAYGGYDFNYDVRRAHRFEYEELLDFMREHESMGYLGFAAVRIEDCTFKKMKTDEELVKKYADLDWTFVF